LRFIYCCEDLRIETTCQELPDGVENLVLQFHGENKGEIRRLFLDISDIEKSTRRNKFRSERLHMTANDQLRIDLHVHTRRSLDGVHSIRSIAKYACKIGLDAIAITDHNILLPKNLARDISREFGILVIPGVEGGGYIQRKALARAVN
jgi:DNA polymerase III alpha subunit (gram-positive type)